MPVLYPIPQMVIGFTPPMAGRGHLTTIGDGHPFIMDVGLMTRFMDGCGFQDLNRGRHGYHGDPVVGITDGLL